MKSLIVRAFRQWLVQDPFTYSAAAAYYAVFAMPGLLVSVIGVASLFFDRQMVTDRILQDLEGVLGPAITSDMHDIVARAWQAGQGPLAFTIGLITLLFGATGLFVQLQQTLNRIWQVRVRARADYLEFLKSRIMALGVMIAIGFLLMVSMILTALLSALTTQLMVYFPPPLIVFFHALDFLVSLGMIIFLFSLMYKVLPDVHLPWRVALPGGLAAGALFKGGSYLLMFYFLIAKPQSVFGMAGTVILFMMWVFYSCLIFLFGAHFASVCAYRTKNVRPTSIARAV